MYTYAQIYTYMHKYIHLYFNEVGHGGGGGNNTANVGLLYL